jgi:hypothetical protein
MFNYISESLLRNPVHTKYQFFGKLSRDVSGTEGDSNSRTAGQIGAKGAQARHKPEIFKYGGMKLMSHPTQIVRETAKLLPDIAQAAANLVTIEWKTDREEVDFDRYHCQLLVDIVVKFPGQTPVLAFLHF